MPRAPRNLNPALAQTIKIMLKENARSVNKLRLHFLSYILSYILQIVTITYIVT